MAKIGIDVRLWSETGVGRYIRNLLKELDHLSPKHEFVLFALSKDIPDIQANLSHVNYHIVKADIRWHTVAEQTKFARLLQKEKLDLMHFPYFSVPVLYKKPYIVTVHDLIVNHFPTGKASTLHPILYWLKHRAYRVVLSQAIKQAKKIITVSEATKKEILNLLPIEKSTIAVTYEGVDTAVIAKKDIQFGMKNPYFLYVGNAYPHKNLEKLLEAFDKLRHTVPDPVRLVFVGKEDFFYKRLKQKVISLGLSSFVLFYDKVADENLSLLYQHAIALVMPSLMEGFGLPALEAMANDCLVIASRIPSLEEICGEAAEYVNPNNADDIYRVMDGILYSDVPYLDQKRALGKRRIKDFSWASMAEKTLEIYNDVLKV